MWYSYRHVESRLTRYLWFLSSDLVLLRFSADADDEADCAHADEDGPADDGGEHQEGCGQPRPTRRPKSFSSDLQERFSF